MSRRISFRPLIFLVLCLLVVMYLARTMSRQGDITYSAMRENFVQEKVQSFTVSDSRLTATLKDQTTVTCPIRDFTLFYDDLNDLVVEQYSKGIITQYDYPAAPGTNWLQVLLPYVLAIMAFTRATRRSPSRMWREPTRKKRNCRRSWNSSATRRST